MKKCIVMPGIIFLVMLHAMAFAGEKEEAGELSEIEKMVVTTTMTEKIMKDTPGSIEVITEEDIISMNALTVAEVLEEAAGLFLTNEAGRQERPSIRGTGNKHTLVLIDGRRIASGFKDLTGLEQIPVDMVRRIEVVRGPGAAIYGSDAIGGVVNIITKKPSEKLNMGLTGQYGQSTYAGAEEKSGSAYIASSAGPLGFLLAGSYRDKNGYDRDGVTPDDGDSIEQKSIGGRISYKIKDNQEILTGLEIVELNTVGLRPLEGLDRIREADNRRINYFLEYNVKMPNMSMLMLRANRSEHKTENDFTPETAMIPGAIGDENNSERFLNQFEGRYTAALLDRHLLTLGAEYREEVREDASGMDNDIHNLSVYLQDEYQLMDSLYLLLSARWDDHSTFGSKYTPRASLTYNIIENLRVKTSWAQGFRSPDISELYVPTYMRRGKEVYEPNTGLDPEKSDSYEAGLEGEIGRFDGRIMWFKNDIKDLIDPVFYRSTGSGNSRIDYYQYRNISKATMTGLELETGYRLSNGLRISGNIAWLDTENNLTGLELEGRPDYKGIVRISHDRLPWGLSGNIRINYIGERYYAAGNEDDETLVHAYLYKELYKNIRIFAGADNVFNTGDGSDIEPAFYYSGLSFRY
ncbi:MAG: TonB-dependent receptor [Deltaproteobacteria bacterium]|nr:TonB-dependent receptor [Deltaproteobacteria bacterium]